MPVRLVPADDLATLTRVVRQLEADGEEIVEYHRNIAGQGVLITKKVKRQTRPAKARETRS